jgi:hypothetical protein
MAPGRERPATRIPDWMICRSSDSCRCCTKI